MRRLLLLDIAWLITFAEGYVLLSKQQMQQLGKYSPSSVRAADGSGYLGLVGVLHQLHCLYFLQRTNALYTHLYPNTMQNPTVPVEMHIRKLFHDKLIPNMRAIADRLKHTVSTSFAGL